MNCDSMASRRRRLTMHLQVNHTEMSCENVYRKCSLDGPLTAMKEENDEDCVWCAQNGTLGHSISYEDRRRCEGVIVVDSCPPIIKKVPRLRKKDYPKIQ